jgi:hypothetical protein
VSPDPRQAGARERVRQLLLARGVRFPAETPAAVRRRVFGPDGANDAPRNAPRNAPRAAPAPDTSHRSSARDDQP